MFHLLNELRKRDKMRELSHIFITFFTTRLIHSIIQDYEYRDQACFNSDQTWFSDAQIFARPLSGVKILVFQALCFNTTLGVQQMLMHRKSCLIPILIYIKYLFTQRSGMSV